MRKAFRILSILFILLFVYLSPVMAEDGGASDARLLFFPRSVVNNGGVMIELSQQKELTKDDFNASFSAISDDNLSLFRLRDNLFTGQLELYTDNTYENHGTWRNPDYYTFYNQRNGVKYGQEWSKNLEDYIHSTSDGHYTFYDGNFSTNSTVVKITTTGIFANEYNPTETREFTLQCFCVEQSLVGSSYNEGTRYEIALGTSSSDVTTFNGTNGSNATSYFYQSGNDYYLFIPSSPYYVIDRNSPAVYYPKYIRHFDICIKLADDNAGLEPGYYSTSFSVTSNTYKEYEVIVGGKISLYPDSESSISESFTVRGYVGYEPSISSEETSFSILSSSDSYTMNLKNTTSYYDVAILNFYSINLLPRRIVESAPGNRPSEPKKVQSWSGTRWSYNGRNYSSQEAAYEAYYADLATWESNNSAYQNDQGKASKYTIYISPTNDYTQSGTYKFIKANTEGQTRTNTNTINYDLYKTNTGTKFDTQSGLPSTTYKVLPEYSYFWIGQGDESVGTTTETRETWLLDNQHVFLKVNDNDEHEKGMYYSYIYITLVTNDSITND